MIDTGTIIEKIDYDEYSNKQLLAVPLTVFFLALVIIGGWFVMTGSPVILGIEFTGGVELRVSPTASVENPNQAIRDAFETEPSSIRTIPARDTYIVTFRASAGDVQELANQARKAGFEVRASSSVSPSFGGDSQRMALIGLLIAFAGMSVVVFGLFRSIIPSIAVIASALSDLIIPLAIMNLLHIELSLGTVAALLMLLGYSVDSDMLLNDYVVRRGEEFYDGVYTAMDTGITMTFTSIVAMIIMAFGGFAFGIPLLREIGIIIVLGLLADLMNTYLMNVTLLRWYRFKGVSK